jgi:tetratricopeptide (TPR) repeat protein
MTETNRILTGQWTRRKAILLSVCCLAVGIAGGWAVRGTQRVGDSGSAKAAVDAAGAAGAGTAAQTPDLTQLKQMADAKAAPMLDQLKSNPNSPELLAGIGNLYYDAQQYSVAVDYYGRALKAKPADAAVRTDLGTAYWFMGNADAAISEFNKALTYAPDNPNTLFNRGLVRWKGKSDLAGAVADWEKLLATDPNYDGKDKVKEMMAEVKKQQSSGK